MPTITTVDTTWTNGVAMDEAELRRADSAMFLGDGSNNGVRGGIVRHGDNSLAVSVNGSDQVTVQAGAAVIPAATGLGVYRASLSAATAATAIDSRNATNPRKDLVVFRSTGAVDIITGTPGASPSAPALPANAVELGRLNVPAVGGGAVTVDTSFRTYTSSLGGTLYAESISRLPTSGVQRGQRAVTLNTNYEHLWTGSAWEAGTHSGNYTPNTVNVPSTLNYARYAVNGGACTVWALWTVTGTGGGPISVPLPFNARTGTTSSLMPVGRVRAIRQGVGTATGDVTLNTTSSVAWSNADGAQWTESLPYTWQSGDLFATSFTFPL